MVCLEKQVKILACTFWFGHFSVRLAAIYRKNKIIFVSLAIFAVGSFSVILMDRTYCHRVASLMMAQPFAGRLLGNQLGQLGGLVFGALLIRFSDLPVWGFALYLSLVYSSQIYRDILIMPLFPKEA